MHAILTFLVTSMIVVISAFGQVHNPANGHEYWIMGDMSIFQARSTAAHLGGYVISISDSAEQAWIDSVLRLGGGQFDFWLGASDSLVEGEWRWQNDEPWDYSNWYPGEPNNNGDEDFAYASMLLQTTWVDCAPTLYGVLRTKALIIEVDSHLVITGDTCQGPHSVRHVPADYATIQDAVNAACFGDTVLVAPGYYTGPGNTDVRIDNRLISIISVAGPDSTIIDCQGSAIHPSRAFRVFLEWDRKCLIEGFTIINGYAPKEQWFHPGSDSTNAGGAIYATSTSPSDRRTGQYSEAVNLRNCRFINCKSMGDGGAVAMLWLRTSIENCRFSIDTAYSSGGGLMIVSSFDVSFDHCIFDHNYSTFGAAFWSGARIFNLSSSTFFRNDAPYGYVIGGSDGTMNFSDVIIANSVRGVPLSSQLYSLHCTNIYGNGYGDWVDPVDSNLVNLYGNLSAPPMFCDTTSFAISDLSPCAPANNNCGTLIGAGSVSCTNHAPSTVTLISPPAADNVPVYSSSPIFSWTTAADPDPFDTVRYALDIGVDSSTLPNWHRDSLVSGSVSLGEPLSANTGYWWRVTATDLLGAEAISSTRMFRTWTPGDLDTSLVVDVADLTNLIDHLFINISAVTPAICADVTGDCRVDIADLTRLIDHLFITFSPLDQGCE